MTFRQQKWDSSDSESSDCVSLVDGAYVSTQQMAVFREEKLLMNDICSRFATPPVDFHSQVNIVEGVPFQHCCESLLSL